MTTLTEATLLSRAVAFAAAKHADQTDKNGQPYLMHPLRLMLRAKTPNERLVAILHDVMEDCDVKEEELRVLGLPEEAIEAIKDLTRQVDPKTGKNELYIDQFIERIKYKPLARAVKLLDLDDNMDPIRRPPGNSGQGFESMLKKYSLAKMKIEAVENVERLERELKKAKELI